MSANAIKVISTDLKHSILASPIERGWSPAKSSALKREIMTLS
jgi:hypothetical protein